MSGPSAVAQRPSTKRKMQDILEAARAEFFANGFAAASIEAIAGRAEVSKVTIYNHFGDKEKLFGEMLRGYVEQISANFQISHLDNQTLREILISAGLQMLEFMTQEKMIRFERMLGAEINRDPKLGKFFLENGPRALLRSLAEMIEAAAKRGEIDSDDLARSAEMFPSLVIGRMEMMMRYGWKPGLTPEDRRIRVERAVDDWLAIHKK